MLRYTLWFLLLLPSALSCIAQTQKDLATFTAEPRKVVSLPEDYSSIFPATQADKWEQDYKAFNKFIPKTTLNAQEPRMYKDGNVQITITSPSIMPHVLPDSSTFVRYRRDLLGFWRAVTIRTVLYTDSCSLEDNSVHREAKQISENKDDDMIAFFNEDLFKVYIKDAGKDKFKVAVDSRYFIEAKRYLMSYKMLKSAATPSIIALDKEGRFILNAYTVTERRLPGKYFVYETVMQQVVFEKLNVQQLHYDKEHKQMGAGRHVAPN